MPLKRRWRGRLYRIGDRRDSGDKRKEKYFMKCMRVALKVDVEKYEIGKGMEDGVELWTDVVTRGWFVTDSLVQIKKENGAIVCPYILHKRGKTFIAEGDYIITDVDGSRHVCSGDKIFDRYKPIEE